MNDAPTIMRFAAHSPGTAELASTLDVGISECGDKLEVEEVASLEDDTSAGWRQLVKHNDELAKMSSSAATDALDSLDTVP